MATRVILDTDLAMGVPGSDIDDGFALALAVADPAVRLEAITTVNGNTDVESAGLLTLELLSRLGREDIRVVRGAAAPLLTPDSARSAPESIRRSYGHRTPAPGYAAAEIARRVMASPGEITLVAIGPLTNIAVALSLEPRLADTVKEIVVMGGVFLGHTNMQRMPGEFNIWVDPEAAAAVFRSGAPLRLVGLDVTLKVRMSRQDARRLQQSGRPFAEFAGRCTDAWIDHMRDANPGDPAAADSCALHDPLAMAAVTHPELITWRPAHVGVVTGPSIARGMTVADLLTSDSPPAANCSIAVDVDAAAFTDHFVEQISRL